MKLDGFLKCKKVRCLSNDYAFNEQGKAYKLHGLRVFITDETGCKAFLPIEDFEPVLEPAENPLQDIELTPEFKVGDKVYIPNIKNLCTIRNDEKVITSDGQYYCNLSDSHDLCFVLATQENYEMLCKLYPHIEFEAAA